MSKMTRKDVIGLFIAIVIYAVPVSWLIIRNITVSAELIDTIILFTLASATIFYAIRTSDIAKATREQAAASVKMAEEMRDTRYDALRPIIDIVNIPQTPIELASSAYTKELPKELPCKLRNIGVGPATDVYSFVYHGSDERGRYNFGTIVIGKETDPVRLSLSQKDDHWFLVAYYKDVYDRWFKSSREVRRGAVNPDPLKIREITEEELPK